MTIKQKTFAITPAGRACQINALIRFASALAAGIILVPCAKADYYAAQSGQTPSAPYTTWSSAASNIQDAVNAATTNDTVWVGAGRYIRPSNPTNYWGTNVVFVNRFLTLRSSNGIPDSVIIDGEGQNRCLTMYYSGNSTNRYILDGVTISNGMATNGAGLLLESVNQSWTAVVQNCVFTRNRATSSQGIAEARGGGIYTYNAGADRLGLLVSNCVFRANVAFNSQTNSAAMGGGMCLYNRGLQLVVDCLFEDNESGQYGGAIGSFTFGADIPEIERSVFRRNRTTAYGSTSSGGGAVYTGGGLDCRNSLFYHNWAYVAGDCGGGAVGTGSQYEFQSLIFRGCTIVSNQANRGGGIYIRKQGDAQGNPSLEIYNSIVQSNQAGALANGHNVYARPTSGYTNYFVNSCWYPTNGVDYPLIAPPGTGLVDSGSVTSAPRFVDFAGNNFRLNRDSPCINAGLNQSWVEGAKDLDNHSRIDVFSGRVDIGCYEYLPRGMMFKVR
jgi:hypothetical protein